MKDNTKRVERRMNDLRKEIELQSSLEGVLVRSPVRWVGHVETMSEEKWTKTTETQNSKDREGEGGLQLWCRTAQGERQIDQWRT